MASRRKILQTASSGFGWLAFAALAQEESRQPTVSPRPRLPAAKRVIFLCMSGGPSHVDLFDHKPKLATDSGREAPPVAGKNGTPHLLGSPWSFARHGTSGAWVSELLPALARHVDELCILRGMQTDQPAHAQAFLQMHTGSSQFVRPSMGSWILYGLGSLNQNLPGFITIAPSSLHGGARNYGSGFLPAILQATKIGEQMPAGLSTGARSIPEPEETIADIADPRLSPAVRRAQLNFIQRLNAERRRQDGRNPEVEGVIESFELAFRMQCEAPQVMDLGAESAATRKLYGIDEPATAVFGRRCLLARRFLEAGVRFVQVTHSDWDQHRNLKSELEKNCQATDRPIAGLLTDLRQRGLLADTLVLWGGEFGRTPHAQGNLGRDHNNKGFTMWMAGGGVTPGLTYGATDDYGYEAIDGQVHIHDWQATILHLLGLDHERLTFRHGGRDFRLTDMKGRVVKEVLA